MSNEQIRLELRDPFITATPPKAASVTGKQGGAKPHAMRTEYVVQHVVPNVEYVIETQPAYR